MIKQSIGLIETVGLSAAIAAADTAVKSANVTLIGYELSKGGGMVVVKILGEVGAVNAAIAAASIAATKVGKVYATKVIARVAEGIDLIVNSQDTKIQKQEPEAIKTETASPETASPETVKVDKLESIEVIVTTEEKEVKPIPDNTVIQTQIPVTKAEEDKKIVSKNVKEKPKSPPKGKK